MMGWWAVRASGKNAATQNLVARDFTATVPNIKWVTDITYIGTAEH